MGIIKDFTKKTLKHVIDFVVLRPKLYAVCVKIVKRFPNIAYPLKRLMYSSPAVARSTSATNGQATDSSTVFTRSACIYRKLKCAAGRRL